jgi:1,4-alpha-glucan branching enzyme
VKVIVLTMTYPPEPGYAVSRYACGLCEAMARAGHEVHVLTSQGEARGREESLQAGVRVHRVVDGWPLRHYDGDCQAVLDNVRFLGRGLGFLSDPEPVDLVACHGWETALAGHALKELLGVPLIYHAHRTAVGARGPQLNEGEKYVAEMEAWAAAGADAVVCPSESLKEEVLRHCRVDAGQVQVIEPACDTDRISPGGSDLDDFRSFIAGPGDLLVLFTGRLEEENGPCVLLDALPQVLDAAPEVRAVFAGEGGSAVPLMTAAQESGIAERCVFVGHVADRVLGCLYACADLLVAPAAYAPSGAAAVEAMAFGTPVVGSDAGALRGLIADGVNGLRVQPGDPDALAGAVIWLTRNRDRLDAMGKCALERAGCRTSWQQQADAFVALAAQLRAVHTVG